VGSNDRPLWSAASLGVTMHTCHWAIRAWTLAALLAMGALLTVLSAIA